VKIKSSLIILIATLLLPAVIYAVFFDTESSNQNIFTAATLDISFSTQNSKEFELTPGNPVVINANIQNLGNLPNNNYQKFFLSSKSWHLASKINLVLNIDGEEVYNGKLSNYVKGGLYLPVGGSLPISYIFSIAEEEFTLMQGKTTTFKISNIASQIGFTYPDGFYDTEKLTFTISIPEPAIPQLTGTEESNLIPQSNEETL
jgi:hypothetical protein